MALTDLISIIIPVYNRHKELDKALDSISAQAYKNIEIIIVDDGSKEPVSIQLSEFSNQIIRQDNKGAPAARNRGLKEAKGQYIIFWDSDVIARPDMLQKMYNKLQANPKASYAYSDYRFGWKKIPSREFDASALTQNNYIMSTSLIRRTDFPMVGWDENLKRFQDWDLWLTMLKNNKIGVYIPECLFKVIPNKKGISTWLPKFFYHVPWKSLPIIRNKVADYESAMRIVKTKHEIRREGFELTSD